MTPTTCTAPGCAQPLDRRGRNVSGLCRRHARDLGSTPEAHAKRSESMRAYARQHPAEVRRRCVIAARAQLAWCPLEYRDEYRHLTRVKQLPAAEARTIIERAIATDARRYAATGVLPQFQRSREISL